eukprot:gb/GEZN01004092.1/.p1 GENE.gb/GEZN01004092.1/~~gb/GEZN01004092.1/.p1  ORF type:complete len:569 (-),score=75.91 gb/GEZN01004092.1/:22-1728(-)
MDVSLANDQVCQIEIVKKSDGLSFIFSSVGTQNPSGKVGCLFPGQQTLKTPRRLPAVFTARVSSKQRFLYVLGGDTSNTAAVTPSLSVEVSALDTTGVPGAFRYVEDSDYYLPHGAGFAAFAQIGSYFYVIGGHNGTNVIKTVQRALVLNPFDTGTIDVDVKVLVNNSDNKNFTLTPFSPGGLYYYRVSALFGPDDLYNPSGETLASEPLNVVLPSLAEFQVELELEWDVIPRAVGYRLYRTPQSGRPLGNISLLAETTTNKYRDDGSWPNLPTRKPKQVGQLGKWASQQLSSQLIQPRWGASAAATAHPTTPNLFFLYVFYGYDTLSPTTGAGGEFASGIEVATVTVYPQDSLNLQHERQTMSAFRALTGGPKRALHRTLIVDGLTWSAYGRNVVLLVVGGTTGTAFANTVEWFHILNQSDGTLGNKVVPAAGNLQNTYKDLAGAHMYVRSGGGATNPVVFVLSGMDTGANGATSFPTWSQGYGSVTYAGINPSTVPNYGNPAAGAGSAFFPANSANGANSGCTSGDLQPDRVYSSLAFEYARQYVIGGVSGGVSPLVSSKVVWGTL